MTDLTVEELKYQLDMWVGPFSLKPKEEQAYNQLVKLIEDSDKGVAQMDNMGEQVDEELIEWVDKTLRGWEGSEISHAKALAIPNLVKAIKKDCQYLKRIKQLLTRQPRVLQGEGRRR